VKNGKLTAIIVLIAAGVFTAGIVYVSGGRSMDSLNRKTNNGLTIPAIDAATPEKYETATFAEGCFWGVESRFGALNGVIRTRVGYAGGSTRNPTYHNIGDHTESVQVDYDPAVISYQTLLNVFWESQDLTMPPGLRQYMSLIIYHNEEQRKLAITDKQRLEKELGAQVQVGIIPLTVFYPAEDYHQKWDLQNKREIAAELKAIYPRTQDFVNSTAATRINGYLGGNGTPADFEREVVSFGLSAGAAASLRSMVIPNLGQAGRGDTCGIPGI
jgi:peptide-methionine (S)-S-oxide reductase